MNWLGLTSMWRCDMVWYSMKWYIMVWNCLHRCKMVWYCKRWYEITFSAISLFVIGRKGQVRTGKDGCYVNVCCGHVKLLGAGCWVCRGWYMEVCDSMVFYGILWYAMVLVISESFRQINVQCFTKL